MERLTRHNINVNMDTDRFLHAAIGGKEIDWKQSRDSTLNVMINGPTSNGFGKDIFRKMARDLYGRLKAYEDTGLEPEEVLPKDMADEIALKLMRLADLESLCNYTRLRELAEADKDGRVVVLPGKVGTPVWANLDGMRHPRKCVIEFANIGSHVTTIVFSTVDGLREQYGANPSSFGKTVFLTSEEAGKALQEME